MKSKEKNTKKALNVRVDAEAFQNLKILCVERNVSLANVLDGYLRELQKQRLMGSKYVDNLIFD